MRNMIRILWIPLAACILWTACDRENEEEQKKEEEMRMLQEYLETNGITQSPTASGLYYIQLEPGEGGSPDPGSWVDIQYTGQLVDGTVFETNLDSVAREHGIYDPGMVYGLTRLLVQEIGMEGLKEGIQLMSVGEMARLIIPSDLGIGADSRLLIPPYSTLIFDIHLMDEFTDPFTHQVDELIEYFGDPLTVSDTTPEGIYFFEEEVGWGDTILPDDEIQIWYTGSFLDGRVFETNEGGTTLTVYYPDQDNIIPGFMSALKYMRGGSSARVVIPYQHAYGSRGAVNDWGQVIIPPYMPLVFDLEIESVW